MIRNIAEVVISKELAESLLDYTNDLLQNNADFRMYDRYDRICKMYEKDIAELKAAIEKDKAIELLRGDIE